MQRRVGCPLNKMQPMLVRWFLELFISVEHKSTFESGYTRQVLFSVELLFTVGVPNTERVAADLEVDINTFADGVFKSKFVQGLHALSPCLGPLVRIVKTWAFHHDINSPKEGTLNSFCLTMLCIYHLQLLKGSGLPPLWHLLPRGNKQAGISKPEQRLSQGSDIAATAADSVQPEFLDEGISADSADRLEPPLSRDRPMSSGSSVPPGCLEVKLLTHIVCLLNIQTRTLFISDKQQDAEEWNVQWRRPDVYITKSVVCLPSDQASDIATLHGQYQKNCRYIN